LQDGDSITIGGSTLRFELGPAAPPDAAVGYDEDPLGHTQLLVSPKEVFQAAVEGTPHVGLTTDEVALLRRKADILAVLYEMSTTLGSVFVLDAIFEKAADILLRATPADRVLVLVTSSGETAATGPEPDLKIAAMKVRKELETQAIHATIGRTITRKVMRERSALLSQDAAADASLASDSIVLQGIRSTICAPLVADSTVHGVLYADRLDPLTWFTARIFSSSRRWRPRPRSRWRTPAPTSAWRGKRWRGRPMDDSSRITWSSKS